MDVIHRTNLQYVPGVVAANYPEPTWKHSPVMTAVASVPFRYWKAPADWNAVGAGPVEMSSGEKAVVDAAIVGAQVAAVSSVFDGSAPPGVFRSVIKPSSTIRSATTVLADDPHLLFPVVPLGKYIFEFRVFFDTTAAADFKMSMNGPASPVGIRFARHVIIPGGSAFSSVGVSTAFNGGGVAVTGTGTTGGYAWGHGILSNGNNAGNVAFMWSQNTSDPGNTTVLEGSMLWHARIN